MVHLIPEATVLLLLLADGICVPHCVLSLNIEVDLPHVLALCHRVVATGRTSVLGWQRFHDLEDRGVRRGASGKLAQKVAQLAQHERH